MKKQLAKLALTAALALAAALTLSCGNHTFDELLGLDSSSSEASSSSLRQSSSSSLQQSSNSSNSSNNNTAIVGPLLKTKWDQESPYNDLFPIANHDLYPFLNGERMLTVCYATALVQIINFHKYPARGKGRSSFVLAGTGAGSVNVSVPLTSMDVAYDWNNMLGEYTSKNPGNEQQRKAVATLMYHYGLATGAGSYILPLVNNFGYDKSFQYLYRVYYSDAEWEAIIRQQLDSGLPVYYEGRAVSKYGGGEYHAIVVDGYDNTGKFHINFGWGGSRDGWYSLKEMDGVDERLNNYGKDYMIINIKPDAGSIGSNEMGLSTFRVSKTSLLQGEGFNVRADIRSFGFFPGGQAGVALVNNSGNIVEVLETKKLDTLNYKPMTPVDYRSLSIDCSIPNTVNSGQYNLRIVTKMSDGEWKIVTASLPYVPKSIPISVGNIDVLKGSFTDTRDSKTYKTANINGQVWMGENMDYAIEDSRCYGEGGKVFNSQSGKYDITLSNAEIQANCEKYGRLYDWEAAMKACPKGWHLPDNTEWKMLMNFAGGLPTAGTELKSESGWNGTRKGRDTYGFSALPGGYGDSRGNYDDLGERGYWWSATKFNVHSAYYQEMNLSESVSDYDRKGVKEYFYSVRCIKD